MPTGPDAVRGDITLIFDEVRDGLPGAMDRLFARVYDDLRRMAQAKYCNGAGMGGGDRLNATALVNEAYGEMVREHLPKARDRGHFYALFLRAMQDVLSAEQKLAVAQKRGGGWRRVPLIEFESDGEILAAEIQDLRQALDELRNTDPKGCDVVMLRFFDGCTIEQTAVKLDLTAVQVRDHWDYARAWLLARLGGANGMKEAKKR